MPMPAEYHEGHSNHENANFALGTTQDADDMTANMYRVGDYVYFETTNSSPYQIRRIEELNKTASGNVEAKVMCFFRRRDLPPTLVMLADKHQWMEEGIPGGVTELSSKQRHQMKHRELFLSRQVETLPATHIRGKCCVTLLNETESATNYINRDDSFFYCLVFDPAQRTLLADKGEIRVGNRYQATDIPAVLTHAEKEADTRRLQDLETLIWTPRHNLTDRQIDQFLVVSRSVGTFARALDCSSSIKQPSLHMSAAAASRDITLFHAMNTVHLHSYDLANAIASLVPSTGPILCRDEMEEWSASEANLFEEALEKYGKDFADIRADFLPWKSLKNVIEYYYMWKTTDRYVQQKRVKAVEAESKLKQVYIPNYPNKTPMSTTAPSTASIVPLSNSNSNSNGKPTSVLNGNSNGSMVGDNSGILMVGVGGKPCEGCQATQSPHWYAWGPSHMNYRLCHACWIYWKKYGGLKSPSRLDDVDLERKRAGAGSDEESKGMGGAHRPHRCSIPSCGKEFKLKAHLSRHYASAHGVDLRGAAGSGGGGGGSPRPIMKTRSAFYLRTSLLARAARRLCATQLRTRHAARAPHQPVNAAPLRHLCAQLASKTSTELRILARPVRLRSRPQVIDIASRLGNHPAPRQPGDWDWLTLTSPAQRKQPDRVSFPRPPKAPDGSLLYERVPNKPEVDRLTLTPPQPQPVMSTPQNILKRTRPFDEINGSDNLALNAGLPSGAPPTKRAHHPQQLHPKHTLEHPTPAVLPLAPPLNGRASHPHMLPHGPPLSRSNARKQVMSWMDAPDDVYFRATEQIKRVRRTMASVELRRAARKPWRRMSLPVNPFHLQRAGRQDDTVVILD
ncbi:PREDICTED: metastasis-associated protein MTA3 isoform X2 [Vollenhovia emeryi]|uniref:metastasis-associated protein MTA3 isoform X2 n=1 Tax=Vollenhovia emeryi TaxID=411798 RepID=UPI0005F57C49|nr:PREDICTED: metastasis-associated protein MTA3 isoform X2 [Vollenhovia emeryi]